MSGYNFALAVHIIAIVAMFSTLAIVLVSMGGARRAGTTQAAGEWAKTAAAAAWLLPAFAIIAYIPAGYMVSEHFDWNRGWIQAAAASLLLMFAGFIVMVLRLRPLARAAREAPDGATPLDLRRRALDPTLWTVGQSVSTVGIGVIVLMTFKPAGGGAIVIIAVAFLFGLLSAAPAFMRLRRLEA
ncbi:MAG: DUF2269 family protein [Dehalococcoidia bacterium]